MVAKRVVGYVRVSTDKQADQGISLEAQCEKIRQYAALYDLALIDIIVDAGVSAKTLKRPGLQQALDMLKSGKAEALLVVKLDRLTRSVKDLGELLERYFTKYALMSVSDQVDTTTAAGELVLNILMSVAQWERKAIGERTKEALHHKKANGEKLGGDCPYGYRVAEGKLIADPAEQTMLAAIRQCRTEGYTLREIAAELTRQGDTTRKGTPFQVTQIARLVKQLKEAV